MAFQWLGHQWMLLICQAHLCLMRHWDLPVSCMMHAKHNAAGQSRAAERGARSGIIFLGILARPAGIVFNGFPRQRQLALCFNKINAELRVWSTEICTAGKFSKDKCVIAVHVHGEGI